MINDGHHAFIPAYPLSAIIESEVDPAGEPAQTQAIPINKGDAGDVEYLAKLLNVNTSE